MDGTWTYGWEHGRELTRMTSSDSTITFDYNADGLRIKKTVNGVVHNYVYSGGKLVEETYGDTKLNFSYDANGNPYTFSYTKGDKSPSVYHYVLNLQGDVVRIVTNKGVTRVTYEYDAWGNITKMGGTNETLANANPLRYRGYYYDQETGLYYLQSRYYNPQWGRFINADSYISTGQGILGNNMFAYCRNNPVCRKDITGTTDVDLPEDGTDLLDEEKSFEGGKISNGGSGVNGSPISNSMSAQSGPSNVSSSSSSTSPIPKYAYDTLEYVNNHNGSPPKGYKGGSSFANDGRNGSARLPDAYAPYREYDVHPKIVGQSRGTERIVVGIGAAFYTPNHYMSFVKME